VSLLSTISWDTSPWLRALVYFIATLIIAWVVDWLLASRGGGVTRRLTKNLPPSGKTRLRLARRLIVAAIVFVGTMIALFELPEVGSLARAMLASAAFTAVIIGLAARSALANPLAGMAIAITQPVRIGDFVTIGDVSGTIEEVALTYTYVRTADNRRVVIPNEQLASTTLHNHTIVEPASAAAVDFVVAPVAPLADVSALALEEARRANDEDTGRDPALTVTDLPAEGPHLRVTVWGADRLAADRAASALRLALHDRLREAKLLPEPGAGDG
jgi:small-conductance mechanosensitive channel